MSSNSNVSASVRPDLVPLLRSCRIFADCSSEQLEGVARLAEDVEVDAGEVLVREGHFDHEFYVIAAGQAEISQHGRTVAWRGPGDHFGELAALVRRARTATVTAVTPMRVLVFGEHGFEQILEDLPQVFPALLAVVAERLQTGDQGGDQTGDQGDDPDQRRPQASSPS